LSCGTPASSPAGDPIPFHPSLRTCRFVCRITSATFGRFHFHVMNGTGMSRLSRRVYRPPISESTDWVRKSNTNGFNPTTDTHGKEAAFGNLEAIRISRKNADLPNDRSSGPEHYNRDNPNNRQGFSRLEARRRLWEGFWVVGIAFCLPIRSVVVKFPAGETIREVRGRVYRCNWTEHHSCSVPLSPGTPGGKDAPAAAIRAQPILGIAVGITNSPGLPGRRPT